MTHTPGTYCYIHNNSYPSTATDGNAIAGHYERGSTNTGNANYAYLVPVCKNTIIQISYSTTVVPSSFLFIYSDSRK